jgi:hypothetical protein
MPVDTGTIVMPRVIEMVRAIISDYPIESPMTDERRVRLEFSA